MWPILVAVPVVTLMVVAVISSLRQRADESRTAALLLGRIDQHASYLDALVSGAAARHDRSPGAPPGAQLERRDLVATLRELRHTDGVQIYERIAPACNDYLAAVTFRPPAAGTAASALTDTARRYDALHRAVVDARAIVSARMEHDARVADFGSGATLAAAVLGICLLFLQLDRTRQTIRAAVAEE